MMAAAYIPTISNFSMINYPGVPGNFLMMEAKCCQGLRALNLPINYVYNPLEYAFQPHANYVMKYCTPKKILFLGMTPGPNGMAQNGVPFGDTSHVKQWLGITGGVHPTLQQDPRQIIQGLNFTREETSGARFWGLMRDICGTPDVFFNRCFVHNYCPFLFLDGNGKNIPLDKLLANERRQIEAVCDQALRECINIIQPQIIVGIGVYAASRARVIFSNVVVQILHPSPASPSANEGWEEAVKQQLRAANILETSPTTNKVQFRTIP